MLRQVSVLAGQIQFLVGAHVTALQLQRLLDRAGMTQTRAAEEIGISDRQMRRYCAGDARITKTVAMAVLHLFCEQTDATKPK